nr:hypothetical protein [Corynebacterium ulceribovis]
MANIEKKNYVDPGWPQNLAADEHPVTEIVAKWAGALSPFGEDEFPVPAENLPYVHPFTSINRPS